MCVAWDTFNGFWGFRGLLLGKNSLSVFLNFTWILSCEWHRASWMHACVCFLMSLLSVNWWLIRCAAPTRNLGILLNSLFSATLHIQCPSSINKNCTLCISLASISLDKRPLYFTLSRGGPNNCSLTSEQWSSLWPPNQSPLGNTLGKELPLPPPSFLPCQVLYVSPFPALVSFLPPCLWLLFYSYLSFKTMSLGPSRSWCEYRVKYSIIFFFFVRRDVQMKRKWEKLEKIGRNVWPQSKETGREGWMEATELPPRIRKTQWL